MTENLIPINEVNESLNIKDIYFLKMGILKDNNIKKNSGDFIDNQIGIQLLMGKTIYEEKEYTLLALNSQNKIKSTIALCPNLFNSKNNDLDANSLSKFLFLLEPDLFFNNSEYKELKNIANIIFERKEEDHKNKDWNKTSKSSKYFLHAIFASLSLSAKEYSRPFFYLSHLDKSLEQRKNFIFGDADICTVENYSPSIYVVCCDVILEGDLIYSSNRFNYNYEEGKETHEDICDFYGSWSDTSKVIGIESNRKLNKEDEYRTKYLSYKCRYIEELPRRWSKLMHSDDIKDIEIPLLQEEYIDPDVFEIILSVNTDKEIRSAIAKSISTPTYLLDLIKKDKNEYPYVVYCASSIVRRIHSKLPFHLRKLKEEELCKKIRNNELNDNDLFDLLIKLPSMPETELYDKSITIKEAIAKNINTNKEILNKLSTNENQDICCALMLNPNTSIEIQKSLQKQANKRILYASMARNLPDKWDTYLDPEWVLEEIDEENEEILEERCAQLCREIIYTNDDNVLRIYSIHPQEFIRKSVALNKSTPSSVLKVLQQDLVLGVREAVTETARNQFEKLPEQFRFLISSSAYCNLDGPDVTGELLDILANRWHPAVNEDEFDGLMMGLSYICKNKKILEKTLIRLAKDINSRVKRDAKEALKERGVLEDN